MSKKPATKGAPGERGKPGKDSAARPEPHGKDVGGTPDGTPDEAVVEAAVEGVADRGPNPIVDLLHRHTFPELGAALRSETGAIIRDWEASVRRALPPERAMSATQLRDHLPKILAL